MRGARVTYDTNILISGFLFDGICERLLRLRFSNKLCLFTSRPIIQEYQEKLREKFVRQEAFVQETTRLYLEFAKIVSVSTNPRQFTIARAKAPLFRAGMKPAPEGCLQLQGCPAARGGEDVTGDVVDNQVIETALVSNSHYLVTGDRKHLVSLGKVDSVEIILPSDFMQIASESMAEG